MKYKLAIFDLAGTTVKDSNTVGSCLQKSLINAGIEVSVEHVNEVMGMPKNIAIKLLLEKYDKQAEVEPIHSEFQQLMIETYRVSPEVEEIEGVSFVFAKLKEKGIRIAVNTGFDRETTDILLGRLHWQSFLDDSIASDEVERGRPFPDMIQELCRRAEVETSETIKVGDTPADLKEGAAAKVGLNVGVLYGTHTKDQLSPYNPDALLSDIRELLALEL